MTTLGLKPSEEDVARSLPMIAYLLKPYFTTPEAALFLGTSNQVLKASRVKGELFGRPAPEFLRIGGKKVAYSRQTLIDWLEASPRGTVSGAES